MKSGFRLTLLLNFAFIGVSAQVPNWAEQIAPILYTRCTHCHNPNGLAGTSFLDYSDVYNFRFNIKYQVENKIMPPWPGDPNYRHYAEERVLKPSEIEAIQKWVDGGAPEGDKSKAPVKPVYSNAVKIGSYDLKIKIPTYTSTADGSDIYRCFSLPANLTADKFVTAIEIVPGNPKIVHHVLVFQDTTDVTDKLDKADPLPGYTNFGGTGSGASILLAPYVPGAEPITFPSGTGVKLYKNARIILQIHYPAGSHTEKDSSYVVFRYAPTKNLREVYIAPLLEHRNISNGPLVIPKDEVKTFYQSFTSPVNATLLSVMPHMHLIGKSTKVFVKQANGDTIPLVRIKDWDFAWQQQYKFQYLQKLSTGDKIQSIVTYDNTVNNPKQPNNPPRAVFAGEATTSEMMLTFFYFMFYQNGDENILQDSSLLAGNLVSLHYPKRLVLGQNPVDETLVFDLPQNNRLYHSSITDAQGRKVYEKNSRMDEMKGKHHIDVSHLKTGYYYLKLEDANGQAYFAKFLKS